MPADQLLREIFKTKDRRPAGLPTCGKVELHKTFPRSPHSKEHRSAFQAGRTQSPTPRQSSDPRPEPHSPAVFMSVVESVGTTLRGTAGLGERAGELGSHELRSAKEKFSCKSNLPADSSRGDWVSGSLGSRRLSQQEGGQAPPFLPDPSPDGLRHLSQCKGSSGRTDFNSGGSHCRGHSHYYSPAGRVVLSSSRLDQRACWEGPACA